MRTLKPDRRRADPGCAGGFAEARAALWRAAKAERRVVVAAAISAAVEGGILPLGMELLVAELRVVPARDPPGKMPRSTAGGTPAATLNSPSWAVTPWKDPDGIRRVASNTDRSRISGWRHELQEIKPTAGIGQVRIGNLHLCANTQDR